MASQEALDREIYAQGEIINDDQAGLRSPKTSAGDRILLKAQIVLRRALSEGLMKRRWKLPFIG